MKSFNFRPYTFTSRGVAEIELSAYLGSTLQISNDKIPLNILTWLAIISLTLLPLLSSPKWESSATTPSVWWDIGYDQSTIQITWEMCRSDTATAKSQFVGESKEHITAKSHSIYWSDKAMVGVRFSRGLHLIEKKLKHVCKFVKDQREETLEIAEAGMEHGSLPSHKKGSWGANCLAGTPWCKCWRRKRRKRRWRRGRSTRILKSLK